MLSIFHPRITEIDLLIEDMSQVNQTIGGYSNGTLATC